MNGIAELLSSDGYIITNKVLIKKFGLHSAVLIGELCAEYVYWKNQDKLEDDDSFFSTRENIEDNTGLNEHFQRKALAELTQKGIITIVKKGMPAVNYYKIDFAQLFTTLITSDSRDEQQVIHEMNINNNKKSICISKDIHNTLKKNKEKDISQKPLLNTNSLKQKDIDRFVNLYNEHCSNLSKVKALTDKRKKAIQVIIKNYSWDDIITVFDLTQESDFLTGNNDRGWKANIDFILREDKFVSILEGKYNSKKKIKSADGLVYTKAKKGEENGRIYHF